MVVARKGPFGGSSFFPFYLIRSIGFAIITIYFTLALIDRGLPSTIGYLIVLITVVILFFYIFRMVRSATLDIAVKHVNK